MVFSKGIFGAVYIKRFCPCNGVGSRQGRVSEDLICRDQGERNQESGTRFVRRARQGGRNCLIN
jgi:hypothetical protein